MKSGITFLAASAIISVVQSAILDCDWVIARDCGAYKQEPECGTDGVTYPNMCDYAKAQCAYAFLHLRHHGACLSSEASSTPSPVSREDRETAILDLFCTHLSKRACGPEFNKVCGTDGMTYLNFCEFDKAKCMHRSLNVITFGNCVTK